MFGFIFNNNKKKSGGGENIVYFIAVAPEGRSGPVHSLGVAYRLSLG